MWVRSLSGESYGVTVNCSTLGKMIKIADSFASINIGGGDKPGEVSSHSVVISTIPEEHEVGRNGGHSSFCCASSPEHGPRARSCSQVPAVRPSRKEQWSRAERRAALRELLNNHPHETTDPPSFNFRASDWSLFLHPKRTQEMRARHLLNLLQTVVTNGCSTNRSQKVLTKRPSSPPGSFLFHGLVHILFPWSMLVYLLVRLWAPHSQPDTRQHARHRQGTSSGILNVLCPYHRRPMSPTLGAGDALRREGSLAAARSDEPGFAFPQRLPVERSGPPVTYLPLPPLLVGVARPLPGAGSARGRPAAAHFLVLACPAAKQH